MNYWETYALVVNWASVRLLLALSHIHSLKSKSINFVLVFPQAVLDTEVYIEIPYGFDRIYDNEKYVLKLLRSVYSLKLSNYNFYKKLCKVLEEQHIFLYPTNNCVFVLKNLILIVYIDDILIFSKKKIWIDFFVKSFFEEKEKFELTNKGNIDKYLGVDIQKYPNSTYKIR